MISLALLLLLSLVLGVGAILFVGSYIARHMYWPS